MGSVAYSNVAHPELSPGFDHHHLGEKRRETGAIAAEARTGSEENSPSRVVRAVQTARLRREILFNSDLFADPAWDMLLDLYASHLEQVRVSVSSLCVAARVPATTALRWIARLEQDGLAVRANDPMDGRRNWIDLTGEGVDRMRRYFEMLPAGGFGV